MSRGQVGAAAGVPGERLARVTQPGSHHVQRHFKGTGWVREPRAVPSDRALRTDRPGASGGILNSGGAERGERGQR